MPADEQGKDLLHYLPDTGENLPSTLLETLGTGALLAASIDVIPEIERTVLSLYYHEELTLREIAQVVNLHESRISQLEVAGHTAAARPDGVPMAGPPRDGWRMSGPQEMNGAGPDAARPMDGVPGPSAGVHDRPEARGAVAVRALRWRPTRRLLWWEQPFQISREAWSGWRAPQPTWEHAGTVTLQAAGLETVEITEARNTWLEILGQVAVRNGAVGRRTPRPRSHLRRRRGTAAGNSAGDRGGGQSSDSRPPLCHPSGWASARPWFR